MPTATFHRFFRHTAVGVPGRRRYIPYVTLGYGHDRVIADKALLAMDFPVHSFVLLHSETGVGHYRELGHWPLVAG